MPAAQLKVCVTFLIPQGALQAFLEHSTGHFCFPVNFQLLWPQVWLGALSSVFPILLSIPVLWALMLSTSFLQNTLTCHISRQLLFLS